MHTPDLPDFSRREKEFVGCPRESEKLKQVSYGNRGGFG